jgi:hypothetical protein
MFPVCTTDILNQPIVEILPVENGRINLNWMVPNLNETIHTLKHYHIQIDHGAPILVKNTAITVFIEAFNVTKHTIQVHAIDSCDQQGDPVQLSYEMPKPGKRVATGVSSPEINKGMPHIS